jgi:hypothetical protein
MNQQNPRQGLTQFFLMVQPYTTTSSTLSSPKVLLLIRIFDQSLIYIPYLLRTHLIFCVDIYKIFLFLFGRCHVRISEVILAILTDYRDSS